MIRPWQRRLLRWIYSGPDVRPARSWDRVVDMDSVIQELNPDTSQFTSMLMKLSSINTAGSRGPSPDPRVWGDWSWKTEWEQRRDEALTHFEKQMLPQTVIHWMEDELFPTVGRVLQSGDPFFRKGDILRVVGRA